MRSLLAFLLGIVVGGVAVLYLPATRRDELNREFRQQVDALQIEIKNLTRQLKSMDLPNLGGHNPTPTPTPTPAK
jgi:gas vesicle protein